MGRVSEYYSDSATSYFLTYVDKETIVAVVPTEFGAVVALLSGGCIHILLP